MHFAFSVPPSFFSILLFLFIIPIFCNTFYFLTSLSYLLAPSSYFFIPHHSLGWCPFLTFTAYILTPPHFDNTYFIQIISIFLDILYEIIVVFIISHCFVNYSKMSFKSHILNSKSFRIVYRSYNWRSWNPFSYFRKKYFPHTPAESKVFLPLVFTKMLLSAKGKIVYWPREEIKNAVNHRLNARGKAEAIDRKSVV